MLEIGGDFNLFEKPFGAEYSGELWSQHLDRDLALVLEVLGEVHGRHATFTESALDPVAVGESRGESGGHVAYLGGDSGLGELGK